MFAPAISTSAPGGLAEAVFDGLAGHGQKTLPASWLYDEIGSALFEVITLLPEYGLTRADAALLESAADDIIRSAGKPDLILELGSGTGTKTRHILNAATRYGEVKYLPIDISPAALETCKASLGNIHAVRVEPIESTYLEGIELALAHRRPGDRILILFLGSTIGNFDPPEADAFLKRIRRRILPDDSLLLGADLVKPRDVLLRAYDDSLGVTAAFNLNLLARINRELGGEFVLSRFAHKARYNERLSRVEMHLRSRVAQQVKIDALNLTVSFAEDETVWTESSHKFRAEDIRRMGEQAGFSCARQWLDREWGFAETLFSKCP